MTAALRGDSAATHANLRKFHEVHPGSVGEVYFASRLVLAGDYEGAEKRVQSMLESPRAADVSDGKSVKVMLLRQQGRLTEARRFGDGSPNDFTAAFSRWRQAITERRCRSSAHGPAGRIPTGHPGPWRAIRRGARPCWRWCWPP
jgi:hypothetical protein